MSCRRHGTSFEIGCSECDEDRALVDCACADLEAALATERALADDLAKALSLLGGNDDMEASVIRVALAKHTAARGVK